MSITRVIVIDNSLTIRRILDTMVSNKPDLSIIGHTCNIHQDNNLIENRDPNMNTTDLGLPNVASSNSVKSSVSASSATLAMQAIISCDGNGQGWLAI